MNFAYLNSSKTEICKCFTLLSAALAPPPTPPPVLFCFVFCFVLSYLVGCSCLLGRGVHQFGLMVEKRGRGRLLLWVDDGGCKCYEGERVCLSVGLSPSFSIPPPPFSLPPPHSLSLLFPPPLSLSVCSVMPVSF